MKFREHKGRLKESLKTVIDLDSRDELVKHVRELLKEINVEIADADLTVEKYAHDPRTQWDTYIVRLKGYGPIGFTDGPC